MLFLFVCLFVSVVVVCVCLSGGFILGFSFFFVSFLNVR